MAQDAKTRNIFFDNSGRTGADDDLPAPEVIRRAKVLFIDHYGIAGNLRAIRIAREAGIAVVADIENTTVPRLDELMPVIGHLIVSAPIAAKFTGESDPCGRPPGGSGPPAPPGELVVTCGENGTHGILAPRASGRGIRKRLM